MPDKIVQEVLNSILSGLQSKVEARQIAALKELGEITYSSEAILNRLEELALSAQGAVKEMALSALHLKTSQFVASKLSSIPKDDRQLILRESEEWLEDGLIEKHQAEVIRRRYDFDAKPGIPARPVPQVEHEAQPMAEAQPHKSVAPPTPKSETPKPISQPHPAEPRPSLMQTLLSEFSVRIYLYLGAFFVIASAAILAALVEAARLPTLLIATLAFGAGAVIFKKRLPQPSFAFAIIVSFLLPIDAVVVADTIHLRPQLTEWYWFAIFMVMAVIWAGGTWFYESRLFSIASFSAFTIGLLWFDNALEASFDGIILSMGMASLMGLFAVYILKKWKDQKFALPLFYLTQGLQATTLLGSVYGIGANLFESATTGQWIAQTLTWLFAASFYAASDFLIPFVFFPWVSVASLFLVPWLFLSALKAEAPAMIAGFGFWGALIGILSEVAHQIKYQVAKKYHFLLLALSLPLFFVSVLWGFIENNYFGFGALLGTSIIYTIIHAMRPRWYVWTTALLAGIGAYFTFFALPFMQDTYIYFGFQLLIASLLLLVPELFFKQPLAFGRSWNWVPVAYGALVTSFNLLIILLLESSGTFTGEKAIILGLYALLFAAYALRFKQPLIGYLATASTTLCVVFALTTYKLDLWMPALTVLAILFYTAGYFYARKDQTKPWGAMFIVSGLGLGALISIIALFVLEPTSGWYALVIAGLFVIEMFTRRNGYLELFPESLVSIALILILNDFKVHEIAYYVFGISLVWLVSDSILKLTLKERTLHYITWLACGALTVAAVGTIIVTAIASLSAAICFAVYAAFFAAYAWIHKMPVLGYLSTASAAVTMFYALDHFNIETWLPIFTGMALVYYFAGFLIRKRTTSWSEMFRFSGLGLGSLVSLIALLFLEPTGGWYALIVGLVFLLETVSTRNGWFEAAVHILFSIAAFLILSDFKVYELSYILLALSLVWLGGDVIFEKTFKWRKLAPFVPLVGGGIAALNVFVLLMSPSLEAAICFGVYAPFFAVYAWLYKKPIVGYASTVALPLAVYFALQHTNLQWWIFPVIGIAMLYYAAGYFLRALDRAKEWDAMLLFSGLGLGTIVGLLSPFQSGNAEKAIPIAIAATLFALEAYARKNVWLAFPANGLYLISYFTLLNELNVDEPQYFGIGAALLGMLMHFLLVRAKSQMGAFTMGMLSQLALLGTTFLQMVSTNQLSFFFVLFIQSMVILAYGIIMRSRSLVIAPIGFAVLGTVTVLYSALKDLSIVLIVGVTGIILLALGILAVLMRERITTLAERFSDWDA